MGYKGTLLRVKGKGFGFSCLFLGGGGGGGEFFFESRLNPSGP